ncbi:hypothetical protein [Nocardioides sp. T2.26MG-1]|uniref:hypothetical protein n=1 Tax=Nocardioides sp. T2.26MG-1 TaxID=3041166 RepID=UPI002477AE2F|nr:hypothetical protein [Nocardioides sp. T2.26MG-1]CAI9416182.1 hypothetical protein HIDPHFAB_02710 [Nocardioides sp. T2.26MG-1]
MGEGGDLEPPRQRDPALSWLPLPVRGDLPLTAEELRRLVRLHARETTEHGRRRRQAFPPEEQVPSEEQVRKLADRVTRADLALRQLDPSLRDVLDRPDAAQVLDVIRDVKARLGEVLLHRRVWVAKVVDIALGDPGGESWRRLEGQIDAIDRLLDAADEVGDTVVEGVEPSEEAVQAFAALETDLASGQQGRRWFRGKAQRATARLLESARVDGEPVTEAAQAAAVRRALEVEADVAALEQEVAPFGVPVPPSTPRDDLIDGLTVVRDALRAVARLVGSTRRLAAVLGPGPVSVLPTGSLEEAERVGWAGDALVAVREGAQARRDLEAAARTLEETATRVAAADGLDQPAPEVAELALCLRAAADAAYGEWLVKMHTGRRAHRLAVLREQLLARLAETAPALPALIQVDTSETTWAPRIARWPEAWEAARAATPPEPEPEPEPEPVPGPAPAEPDPEPGPATPREVVLALAARGPVSGAEVRAATGLDAARSRALLKQLVAAGELVRTGATSATRWHLAGRE